MTHAYNHAPKNSEFSLMNPPFCTNTQQYVQQPFQTLEHESQDVQLTGGVLQSQSPISKPFTSLSSIELIPITNTFNATLPNTTADSPHPCRSVAELASLLAVQSRPKADTFTLEEIKVLMEEIEKHRHIILSVSPSTNRLKRRAWEFVTASMAIRWPRWPRRTADQLKRKWENMISRTKRKLRNGQLNSPYDWSVTNTLIMEFLARQYPLPQRRYTETRQAMQPHSNPHGQCPPSLCPSTLTSAVSHPTSNAIASLYIEPSSISTHSSQPDFSNTTIKLNPFSPNPSSAAPGMIRDTSLIPVDDVKCNTVVLDDTEEESECDLDPVNELITEEQRSEHNLKHGSNETDTVLIEDYPANRCSENYSHCTQVDVAGRVYIPAYSHSTFHSDPTSTSTQSRPPPMDNKCRRVWLDHEVREHELRMQVLQLQKQSWELQIRLLSRELDRKGVATMFKMKN